MTNEKSIIDIKAGSLLPFQFLVFGGIMLTAGMMSLHHQMILSVILIMISAAMLTAYEGTEIMPHSKTYREYTSILFFKRGAWKKYDGVEKIFINSGKVSQKIYTAHTLNSGTFTDVKYNAYLKFTDGTKVLLLKSKNKSRLLAKVTDTAAGLNTIVVDNSI